MINAEILQEFANKTRLYERYKSDLENNPVNWIGAYDTKKNLEDTGKELSLLRVEILERMEK